MRMASKGSCFKFWSLAGGTVWEELGGVALLEKVRSWKQALRFQKTHCELENMIEHDSWGVCFYMCLCLILTRRGQSILWGRITDSHEPYNVGARD